MRWTLLSLACVVAACVPATEPSGPVADVRSGWAYSGSQTVPALSLSGTLTITSQVADVIEGSLGWSEADGVNAPVLRSGALAGVVIGTTDVDFDVALDGESRRHLGRISADGDSLIGVWVTSGGGPTGTFRAVRSTP